MSRPYFADSPILIRAAQSHTDVIQPPGYWLYVRAAGLFENPTLALSLLNALASAVGALIFYYACLHLTTRLGARLATVAYASIYFAWFAGSVQSSYAGELLSTPLLLFFFFCYLERPSAASLCGIAASYALSAGIRPSDGVFLAPIFFYFLWKHVQTRRARLLLICLTAAFCLLWYVPEQIALSGATRSAAGQFWSASRNIPPFEHSLLKLAISNVVRTLLPLVLAFWPLLPSILTARGPYRRLFWIWLIPGLVFFALVYISDATYLCFLLPAMLALALVNVPGKKLFAAFTCCFAWNVLFFSFARPVDQTHSLPVALYSVDGARYCAWALRHQWYRTLRTYTDVSAIGSGEPRK